MFLRLVRSTDSSKTVQKKRKKKATNYQFQTHRGINLKSTETVVIQENTGKDKINKKVEFNHEIGMIKKQIYKTTN